MVLQECTLLSARPCVGLTTPCHVIMEPILEITAPSMDTLVMFVKPGWTGKYQILREREMELGNLAESLMDIQGFTQCAVNWKEPQAPLVDVSDYGRTSENEYSEPQKSLVEGNSGVKTEPAYTEDSADLSNVVKAPKPVY